MATPTAANRKFPFPPALIAGDILAMIMIGFCLAEIFPGRTGRTLGLIRPDLVWPILWASLGVAAFCVYKMIQIIIRKNRGSDSGDNILQK